MIDRNWLHDASAGHRLLVVVAVVGVTAAASALVAPWQVSVLSSWVVGGAVFLAWVWFSIARLTPEETHTLATREDSSRVAARLLWLSASVASLAGTAFALVKASQTDGAGKAFITSAALATVVISWTVVHTEYTLGYTHEYYGHPVGGIDFKTRADAPDYQDFAYVAFTVGMTFQISDTDIQTPAIRRTVLRHALLSYLFGAVILAVTINVIATIFQ